MPILLYSKDIPLPEWSDLGLSYLTLNIEHRTSDGGSDIGDRHSPSLLYRPTPRSEGHPDG